MQSNLHSARVNKLNSSDLNNNSRNEIVNRWKASPIPPSDQNSSVKNYQKRELDAKNKATQSTTLLQQQLPEEQGEEREQSAAKVDVESDYSAKWKQLQKSTDILLKHMRLVEREQIDYDIEQEYKEELAYLRKERAVRLYKTIQENKLAWCQLDEPDIHEVLGIEHSKRRRMKLIMAKLESRMNKAKRRKQIDETGN